MPERTCVVCRTKRPKGELLRVARSPDGTVVLDAAGRAPGRGAYVCRDRGHLQEAPARIATALRLSRRDELARLREEMEEEVR